MDTIHFEATPTAKAPVFYCTLAAKNSAYVFGPALRSTTGAQPNSARGFPLSGLRILTREGLVSSIFGRRRQIFAHTIARIAKWNRVPATLSLPVPKRVTPASTKLRANA